MESKDTIQKIEQPEETVNERDERQCIETFLNWYNNRFKTSHSYQRAEKAFTEITDFTRWDFVIKQNDYSHWYAIEIKSLVRPEVRIQLIQWNKFLTSIKSKLYNRLQGEFLVYGVPSLKLEKQERTELKRLLTELILQNSQSLSKDKMVDLGPHIISRFKEWPSTPHLNPNLSPPIEHRVNAESCFTLHKLSDTGCSLELGFAQSEAFHLNQAVVEALSSLFDNGEILHANKQLALAKQKGTKGTFLLLDYDLPSWYPNIVRQVLANRMNVAHFSDIDSIYLIKASQKRVSKVWNTNR